MTNNRKPQTELSKLQDVWYAKLEKAGFDDIEQRDGNLKQWACSAFGSRHSNKHLFNSKSKYYELAGQFLHENQFETEREKIIWELHSEGVGMTGIAQEIKRRRYKVKSRSSVHAIIQKLAKEMLTKYGNSDEE